MTLRDLERSFILKLMIIQYDPARKGALLSEEAYYDAIEEYGDEPEAIWC